MHFVVFLGGREEKWSKDHQKGCRQLGEGTEDKFVGNCKFMKQGLVKGSHNETHIGQQPNAHTEIADFHFGNGRRENGRDRFGDGVAHEVCPEFLSINHGIPNGKQTHRIICLCGFVTNINSYETK